MSRELLLGDRRLKFDVQTNAEGATVRFGDESHELSWRELASGRLLIQNSTGQMNARVARRKDRILVWLEGRTFDFSVPDADHARGQDEETSKDEVRAPMPGNLLKLSVAAGDSVEEGQTVALLEAMKMEHNLRAPRRGVVEKTLATTGQIVDAGAVIVVLVKE